MKKNIIIATCLLVIIMLDFIIWAGLTDMAIKTLARMNECSHDCAEEAFSGMLIGFLASGIAFWGMCSACTRFVNKRDKK